MSLLIIKTNKLPKPVQGLCLIAEYRTFRLAALGQCTTEALGLACFLTIRVTKAAVVANAISKKPGIRWNGTSRNACAPVPQLQVS